MAQLPIPKKALWASNAAYFGDRYGLAYTDGTYTTDDQKLTAQYYDAAWVFLQIGDYRAANGSVETKWADYALQATIAYETYGYSVTPQFATQGYRNFPHGLYEMWVRTGLLQYKTELVNLSLNAAYAPDSTPIISTSVANGTPGWDGGSREAAYILQAYLLAEKVGEAQRTKRDGYIDQIIGHFNQWTISQSADYVRPFMMALSSHALMMAYEQLTTDSRRPLILSTLITAWNWAWANTWLPALNCFMYTDRNVATGGQEPAPDLNMLIAPVYAWLYHQTGDVQWRDQGDLVFSGGVMEWHTEGSNEYWDAGGYLFQAKQFNQNYRMSHKYIEWREADPLTTGGGGDPGGGDPVNPPGGTSELTTLHVERMFLPVSPQTFIDKFNGNGWASIQAQIDAGYPLWIQPGATTAQYVEVVDLGALIPETTLVTLTYNPILLDGSVTVTPKLSISTDNSSWTDYAGVTQIFVSGFRYIKVTLDAVATNKKGIVQIDEIRLKLSLKEKRDGGSDTVTVAGTGKTVNFNKTFIDIDQIVVTAAYDSGGGASQKIAVYDFVDVANPTSFIVYLIKQSDGSKTTGAFSWSAKGV